MRAARFVLAAVDEARRRADGPFGRRGLELVTGLLSEGIAVAEAPGIGSARLRSSAEGPVIELDPAFLDRFVRSDADALHLLAHEVLHRVRGDLCRFAAVDRTIWMLFNLALDIFVDAQLERLWFGGDGAPYQRRLYAADRFPEVLLVPPRVLLRDIGGPASRRFLALGCSPFRSRGAVRKGREDLVRAVEGRLRRMRVRSPLELAELYADGWLNQSDVSAFWRTFRERMQDELPQLLRADLPLLLGDHGSPGRPDPMLEELADRVDAALGIRHLPGLGGGLRVETLQPYARKPDPGPLLATLRQAIESDPDDPTRHLRLCPDRGLLPGPGRRELMSLACGVLPVFWPSSLPHHIEDDQRVHLFVDASGSMDEWLPFLFRLCGELSEHIGSSVCLFSNQVVRTSLGELAAGRVESTGGTDFDCVLDHALRKRWRRIVVLSDGWANADEALLERARRAGLKVWVVLFGEDANHEHPLIGLGESFAWHSSQA